MRIIFIFCLILCSFASPSFAKEEPKIYFLRFARSGSHWMFYCLNHLLDKNIVSSKTTSQKRVFVGHIPERKSGNIYVAHNPRDLCLKNDSHEKDILILMVRNYRESLIREFVTLGTIVNRLQLESTFNYLDNTKDMKLLYNFKENHFFHNIRCYERWNEKNRILIYYEDLIENPKEVFRKVLTFFKVSDIEERIEEFCKDFDKHYQKSLKLYKKQGGSQSRGIDLLYHTKKFGEENSRIVDQLVKNKFSFYFTKYLSRYEL